MWPDTENGEGELAWEYAQNCVASTRKRIAVLGGGEGESRMTNEAG